MTLCLEMLNTRVTRTDERTPRLPGGPHRLLHRHHQAGRLAEHEAALRHLPRADHGRRRHQPDSPAQDYIGHVHTAGNPGRGELDDKQEINYKPIMQALLEIGYKGHVGQEFIPTRDPLQGLREAIGSLRCLIDGKAGGLATPAPGWVVKSLAWTKEVGPGRFC